MRYTRPQICSIVQNDARVLVANSGDETKNAAAMNCLLSGLVARGLKFMEECNSFHTKGRPEHTYSGWDLYKYLGGYLAAVENHKLNLRKSCALAITDHLKELGYEGNPESVVADERMRREMIFGKEASDAYYREQGAS